MICLWDACKTAKHLLISCPKGCKISHQRCLTSFLKPYKNRQFSVFPSPFFHLFPTAYDICLWDACETEKGSCCYWETQMQCEGLTKLVWSFIVFHNRRAVTSSIMPQILFGFWPAGFIACFIGNHTEEREINNGRFAMFAAIGIIAAELYTGKDAIEQFGL